MFKLDFNIPPSESKITLKDKIYLSGSCFSDEIGEKFTTYKFDALYNPFGTLYNPLSIFKSIGGGINPEDVVESQGVYYHWDCHGKISGLSKGEIERHAKITSQSSNAFLETATVLVLTLGSSYVYELKETGQVVANCHKVPPEQFNKRLLTKEEIIQSFSSFYPQLRTDVKIIFTVSPVRHIREGLIENNRSKAILLEAVHELVEKYDNAQYFPSYEIVNDELRDYRFFSEDRVHPSAEAVNYVWKRFSETLFDDSTKAFFQKWNKVVHALNHRPFQPKSSQHQEFLRQTLVLLHELENDVDVSDEAQTIQSQLT